MRGSSQLHEMVLSNTVHWHGLPFSDKQKYVFPSARNTGKIQHSGWEFDCVQGPPWGALVCLSISGKAIPTPFLRHCEHSLGVEEQRDTVNAARAGTNNHTSNFGSFTLAEAGTAMALPLQQQRVNAATPRQALPAGGDHSCAQCAVQPACRDSRRVSGRQAWPSPVWDIEQWWPGSVGLRDPVSWQDSPLELTGFFSTATSKIFKGWGLGFRAEIWG